MLAFIIVLSFHEAAHAWVALRLGDPTAHREGRVSLNPLKHLDFMGTLLLFLVGFGWGKPVPVNPRNFKHPVRDQIFTALAGPMANLLLAILAAVGIRYLDFDWSEAFFGALMDISLILFLFNMLPIPPLDGGALLLIFVSEERKAAYERFLRVAMPYFIVVMVVDIYLFPKFFGVSILKTGLSYSFYWLKQAILLLI
jgi:Zn-dependent protease